MQIEFYYWFILGVTLMIMELFTPGFFLLLTGIAACFTGAIAYFIPDILWLQWIIFGVSTILALVLLRKYILNKIVPINTVAANVGGLIGKTAVVINKIQAESLKGQVRVSGEVWIAKPSDGKPIEKNEEVIVEGVSGTKLIVRRK
ncbi:MAG: NfeD family protein [Caldisericia bacterium]|nr:NfeD family protein [Caldisericia bacterium]